MFLTEWNLEKTLEQERRDSEQRGINIGEQRNKENVARAMLKENYPLSAIVKITQLSEAVVLKLAKNLGVQLA